MRKSWLIAAIPGALLFGAAALVLVLFLVKILWAWTVPDLFPGGVEQGLVASSISWFTALKVGICAAVLAGFAGVHRDRKGKH